MSAPVEVEEDAVPLVVTIAPDVFTLAILALPSWMVLAVFVVALLPSAMELVTLPETSAP